MAHRAQLFVENPEEKLHDPGTRRQNFLGDSTLNSPRQTPLISRANSSFSSALPSRQTSDGQEKVYSMPGQVVQVEQIQERLQRYSESELTLLDDK